MHRRLWNNQLKHSSKKKDFSSFSHQLLRDIAEQLRSHFFVSSNSKTKRRRSIVVLKWLTASRQFIYFRKRRVHHKSLLNKMHMRRRYNSESSITRGPVSRTEPLRNVSLVRPALLRVAVYWRKEIRIAIQARMSRSIGISNRTNNHMNTKKKKKGKVWIRRRKDW